MPETWEEAVERVIASHDGVISLQEIYAALESHPLVRPHHREMWGSQPNYHHWIRSALNRLKLRGLVRRVGRGLYISN
jgi:hypothetical protein